MTYEQAFEKIKEKLKDADTSNLTGDFAVQIDLINKDCSGMFYIAYFDGKLAVEPYDYVDNYARLAIMLGDFTKLVEGKLNVEKALEDEKIYITGDMSKIKELTTLVKKAPSKKPSKKADEKKAAPSKKTSAKTTQTEEKKTEKKPAAAKKTVSKKTNEAVTVTEKKTAEKPAAKSKSGK